MSLSLGNMFNRNYNMRIPFLDGFYDIGIFFNKKSTFLLFSVDPKFPNSSQDMHRQVNMFKNLESSKFVETFLDLHNFRKQSLDIINQFQSIKNEYCHDITFLFNETIKLSKVEVDGRSLYDSLTLFGLSLSAFNNESIFIIAERQNIIKKLQKKLVRTTGIQICTSRAIKMINEFHLESRKSKSFRDNINKRIPVDSDNKNIISLNDVDEEQV